MTAIVPIASGKGGVGKTIVTANLGITLAQAGKTVILVDLDLGAANLHTILGIRNRQPGIGHVITKSEARIEDLVMETSIPRLHFLPGDALLPGTANLPFFTKKKIIRDLQNLVADYVLLDLGAGSNYNTVDFFLAGSFGVLVCTPETTSILNAYSFVKTAVYRLLYRSFPPSSSEREIIQRFMMDRIEGSPDSFLDLTNRLDSRESRQIVQNSLQSFRPRVVINSGRAADDLSLGGRLRQIARKNLDIELEYIGFLPRDPTVEKSPFDRKPTAIAYPDSMIIRALRGTAAAILKIHPDSPLPPLYEDDADLYQVGKDFQDAAGHRATDNHA
ncbi:MAG: AAA family ATPase [Spirochaeta sp.]